ncbi:hypothetical protein EJ06DRAFT_585008 [Trichodelitschia bisporula]|uniref:Uncharacterized protein n=1 Tax=Trichodelitschia bisporula TaxID=703511 RepID=A0A6G1HL26_9PEZI|nr:hypothetical protein EJ06DRAFT_585008 [Trichodelitschia bisporula]
MSPQSAAGELASFMAVSLPKDASPQLKTPYEAIALAVHAGMLASGFRLIGLGEDLNITQSENGDAQPLPAEWNASTSHAFRYAHSQSSMVYIVKVNRLGGKAVVDGLALGDDKRATFDITALDYISPSALPATPVTPETTTEAAREALQQIFISPARLADLNSQLNLNIIQKLAPGLKKDGYEVSPEDYNEAVRPQPWSSNPPRPDPLADPAPARPTPFADPRVPPRNPYPSGLEPPGFEDEYEILQMPGRGQPLPRNPLSIGDDDLYPAGMGPNDPFRPTGPRGFPGRGGGGGMHPTFDDPLFQGRGSGGYGDLQVPPGARYDPVQPGDPRSSMGLGRRGPQGGPFGGPGFGGPGFGGQGGNPFGGGDFI